MGKGRRGNQPQKFTATRQSKLRVLQSQIATVQGAKPVIGNDVMDSPEPEMHAIHPPLTLLKLF